MKRLIGPLIVAFTMLVVAYAMRRHPAYDMCAVSVLYAAMVPLLGGGRCGKSKPMC